MVKAIGAPPDFPIGEGTLRQALTHDLSLGAAPDTLSRCTPTSPAATSRRAKALSAGEDPDGDAPDLDVLAVIIEKFTGARPDPEAFVEALDPLQARLFDLVIARRRPGRLSVTAEAVRYRIGRRPRLGVASTFLADRLAPGSAVRTSSRRAC